MDVKEQDAEEGIWSERGRKQEEARENCIMRRSMVSTPPQIL